MDLKPASNPKNKMASKPVTKRNLKPTSNPENNIDSKSVSKKVVEADFVEKKDMNTRSTTEVSDSVTMGVFSLAKILKGY